MVSGMEFRDSNGVAVEFECCMIGVDRLLEPAGYEFE